MNEIKSFAFYKNYYELIKYLPDNERLEIYDSICKYMFEDIEPILKGLSNGIWVNLKMPLDTSKNHSINGVKGGKTKKQEESNEKANENQNESNEKANEKQKEIKKETNNISTFLFLISNNKYINNNIKLRDKVEIWLKYKWERKEYYKETGFKTLLARIISATNQYGVEEVINLIDECMASNYKGIIFEKLEKKQSQTKTKNDKVPEWFNKEISRVEPKEVEKKKVEELLKEFM